MNCLECGSRISFKLFVFHLIVTRVIVDRTPMSIGQKAIKEQFVSLAMFSNVGEQVI